jgi:hypothetical protein
VHGELDDGYDGQCHLREEVNREQGAICVMASTVSTLKPGRRLGMAEMLELPSRRVSGLRMDRCKSVANLTSPERAKPLA